jgi:hypothetical protein
MADKPVKVEIVGDSSNYKKALKDADDASGKFASSTKGHGAQIAVAAGVASVAVGAFAADAVSAASDYNETVSKSKVIFGEASDTVVAFAENAATSLGLSQQAALDAEATFATFGKGAGLAGDDLAVFAQDLTGLAADMASFSNTSPEQAIEAIGAALRGEAEPIRAYGVLLDDATLKQTAMKMGIYDGNGALTQQQKVMAAQKAIFEQTTDAQGDFARTSDGLAGQMKILNAQFENMKVQLGSKLIPLVSTLVGTLNDLAFGGEAGADSFKELNDAMDSGEVYKVINAFQDLITETGNTRSGIDKLQHGVGSFFDQLAGGSGESVRNFAKAFGDLAEKSPEAATAVVQSLREVVAAAEAGNKTSQDFIDKYELSIEKIDEMAASLPKVEDATVEAAASFEHMGLNAQDGRISVANASAALGEAARQADKAQRATDNMAASWEVLTDKLSEERAWIDIQNSFEDVRVKGEEMNTALAEGADDAAQKARDYQSAMVDLREKVIEYSKEIGGLPLDVTTMIQAQVENGSITSAEQLLNHIARARQVIYNAQVANHREYATGTTSAARGLALVGEQGPELVAMGGGERVFTASQTAGMLGGGGNTYNIYPPVGFNDRDLMKALKKMEARNGPGWRS